MCHGMNDTKQSVGECHSGKTLRIVHGISLSHISVVGINQIILDHFDRM